MVEKIRINKYSAFSLIELSIVLIIMGLLVAGITGGASLIETARITSLKREVDDYIRDAFTFYSRTGRLPGDLDGSGKIGWGNATYSEGSFPAPYNDKVINAISASFIELYLYGISSFKPDPTKNGISNSLETLTVKTNIAKQGGMPFSKVYKDFILAYRTDSNEPSSNTNSFFYKIGKGVKSIDVITTETYITNKKTVDVVKKIDLKFDDGHHNGGNIRGWCNGSETMQYANASFCSQLLFFFDIN